MNHSEIVTIEPGKPWQNGSSESFNGTFRAECLDREWFAHLREAKIVIEEWGWEFNTQGPHSSLGYRTPAEIGAAARAAMTRESEAVSSRGPGAIVEAALQGHNAEVHPITSESPS